MESKKIFVFSFFVFSSFLLFSQELIQYNGNNNYILRERTDLRRYDNGKYTGLTTREVSSFIVPSVLDNELLYEGNFYLKQDTSHKNLEVLKGIRKSIPSIFKIKNDGSVQMIEDNGFPSFRSFPTFPQKTIKIGDVWQAKAERCVDPLNKGIITKMPIYVQYCYLKDDYFNNEEVYVFSAKWATRYGIGSGTSYIDWGGDSELEKATGSHNATIFVNKKTGCALVIRDTVDEIYYYLDGNTIQFKGTISLFTEYPPSIDRTKIIPALKRIAKLDENQTNDLLISKSQNNDEQLILNNELLAKKTLNSEIKDLSHSKLEQFSHTKLEEIHHSELEKFNHTELEEICHSELDSESLLKQNLKSQNNSEEQLIPNNELLPKIQVENTTSGIKLIINDLHFVADSSKLLESEKSRIDEIAQVLKLVPNAQFLVEGHTAKTGNDKGEMKLSYERAESICKLLIEKGINLNQFICKGSGSTKPVADNSTNEGKSKNRRVEITILD